MISIAIVDDIFLGFVFSFFFSKHQKIFFGNFFEMQPNTWKYFPFPEISISGKYVFSGKRFTATKHSLKDKLVGEIPGTYAQAFDFTDQMEDDADLDDEVVGLREGLAVVKLTKETKIRIRGPWAKALIVKLYGRKIGFNFIQNKLM